jgi:voltage-gated potassium channel
MVEDFDRSRGRQAGRPNGIFVCSIQRRNQVTIFLLSIALAVATVMMHSIGTFMAIAFCRLWRGFPKGTWQMIVGMMGGLVITLLLVHFAEAALWAVALLWWQALPDFDTALYFSLTSYSTVGYGDVILPEPYRMLGPVESVLGVLMMGWSTAVIVAVFYRVYGDYQNRYSVSLAQSDSFSGDQEKNQAFKADQPRG